MTEGMFPLGLRGGVANFGPEKGINTKVHFFKTYVAAYH